MLLLTSINDKLQIITGSAGDVRCHFSYVDNNAGTITPDRKNTSISTSTTTDVVLAPAASTQRNIKSGIIYNAHATVANLVTVQHTDGTTIVVLEKVTLQPGEFIEFEENGGWTYENSSGIPFAAGLGGPVDVQTFAYPGGTWTKPARPWCRSRHASAACQASSAPPAPSTRNSRPTAAVVPSFPSTRPSSPRRAPRSLLSRCTFRSSTE